jgi:predicted nucleic acid-binding protein
LPGTQKTSVYFHFGLIENDPDDNKFVDCAIAANTDFIITNDRHFRVLRKVQFPKVVTLTLEEFQRFWQNNAEILE